MPRLLNAVASPPDARDYKFIAAVQPKSSTDMRQLVREIEDQAQEGSCSANALTSAIEILTQSRGQWEDLSRQFQYFTSRDMEGRPGQDGVVSLRDSLEAARKFGICLESEWDYLTSNENTLPPQAIYASAATRRVTRYERIDISKSIGMSTEYSPGISAINSALADDMPVIIGLALGQKIYGLTGPLAAQQYGQIDYPGVNTGNPYIGSHAMVIVGNNDAGGYWIVQNSWGTSWGDGGYCALPYNCVRDFSEAWVVRGFKDMSFIDPMRAKLQEQVVRMYVATLGRAPELDGFLWWLEQVANGGSLLTIAMDFMGSAESRSRFANDGQIVCDIVMTLDAFLNRVAVASYFVLDLACPRGDLAATALDGVTADQATIEVARKRIRTLIGGGVV